MLDDLCIGGNLFGDEGVVALAAPLRKLPALKSLILWGCDFGDEGIAALVTDLETDELQVLSHLNLEENNLSDVGCATLASALEGGKLPRLTFLELQNCPWILEGWGFKQNPASEAATQALLDVVEARRRNAGPNA